MRGFKRDGLAVKDAASRLRERACWIKHLLTGAIAHQIERIDDTIAEAIAELGQSVGGIIGV